LGLIRRFKNAVNYILSSQINAPSGVNASGTAAPFHILYLFANDLFRLPALTVPQSACAKLRQHRKTAQTAGKTGVK
jgi:hypothetical protein